MTALSEHQIEILRALSKGPRVERSRVDFLDWQDLEDRGFIARQNVNPSGDVLRNHRARADGTDKTCRMSRWSQFAHVVTPCVTLT